MITSLRIQNFKSWKDTGEIRLAPITGFFGANSSGKSSILQLLLLLKQTVESPDRAQVLDFGDEGDERDYVALGTFRDIVNRKAMGKSAKKIEWKVGWEPARGQETITIGPEETIWSQSRPLQFHTVVSERLRRDLPRLEVDRLVYRYDGDTGQARFTIGVQRQGDDPISYKWITKGNKVSGQTRTPEPFVKCYGFPAQIKRRHQDPMFLAVLELAFERLFERIYYLGPLREYPRRQYTWAGGHPSGVGRRGERTVYALLASREGGQQIEDDQGTHRTVEEQVAWWLRTLKLTHSFSLEEIAEGSRLYRVHVQHTPESAPVSLTDVGFGVSQILPVLTLCYYVPEGSIIILEQPEIHLHPSVQAGLADVFIDAVKTRKVQIILESHSEHLLLRLQRRIAEERIASTDMALYFCNMVGGASQLQPLEMNRFGNITNWPENFFGDDFGERAAMMKEIIRRRKSGEAA